MGRRLTAQERSLRAISEKAYQAQITDLASLYGWEWRHFHDSRREVRRNGRPFFIGDTDAEGWPDLVLVRPPEILVIEVKKELGRTTEAQDHWLALLNDCGIEAMVARPSTFAEVQRRLTRSRPAV